MGKVIFSSLKIEQRMNNHFSKNVVVFICVLFICGLVKSQSIAGTVVNEKGNFLEGVIVQIYNNNASENIDYAITDGAGNFKINLKKGSYKIELTSLGFETSENIVSVEQDIKKTFTLKKEVIKEIKEVVITANVPIKIKSDTVEYNAKSFRSGTEKNVEDLLKKLPGVSVDADGKIKIQGKEIEKVMVENDDFFEKGYTLLTKNMSDKPIDKIQILDHYSNNKLLKGVEKSDKVVINLTLDNEVKTEWFGEVGTSNSVFPNNYNEEKLYLARFDKRYKLFFLGNANSIGKDNIGDIQHLLNPSFINEAGFIDINTGLYTFNSEFNKLLNINLERYRLNNDKLLSNNAIFRLGKKTKIKLINISNFNKIASSSSSVTSYNLGNENFINLEEQNNRFTKHLFFNKIEYDYDITDKTTLKVFSNHNFWKANNFDDVKLNDKSSVYNSSTNNHLMDTNLVLTHKLKEKSVWLLGMRFFDQSIINDSFTNEFYFRELFDFSETPDFFKQNANNKMTFFGVISQYIYRTKKDNVLDVSMQYNKSKQSFHNLMNVELLGNLYSFPADYFNNYHNDGDNLSLNTNYRFLLKKINFNLSLDTHYYNLNSDNADYGKFYLNPALNLYFSPHSKGNIIFSANYNNRRNDLYDLLPNYFNNSQRNLKRGIETEIFTKDFNTNLRYLYGHYTDKFTANIFFSFTNYFDYQANNYDIKPLYSLENQNYLHNKQSFLFSGELSYYLRFMRSNLKLIYYDSRNWYQEKINNQDINVSNNGKSIGLELQSGWKRNFNYAIGGSLRLRKVKSLNTNKTINFQANTKLSYNISKKTYLQVIDYFYSFGDQNNKQDFFNFLDTKLSYNYSEKIQFSLLGNNLLNIKNYQQNYINSYSSYQSNTQIFPRNIMLEVALSL